MTGPQLIRGSRGRTPFTARLTRDSTANAGTPDQVRYRGRHRPHGHRSPLPGRLQLGRRAGCAAVDRTREHRPLPLRSHAAGHRGHDPAERRPPRTRTVNAVADISFTWESSDLSVATVDSAGVVQAAGNGHAMITAAAGSISGTALATVPGPAPFDATAPPTDPHARAA